MEGFTAQDYTEQLRKLMPPGPAWEYDAFPVSCAQEFTRIDTFIRGLFLEALPSKLSTALPEWEKNWGLPDTCPGYSDGSFTITFSERKQRLIHKERAAGLPTAAYFIGLARQLGYAAASIYQPEPCRIGARVRRRLYSPAWAYVWRLHLPQAITVRPLRIAARVGERLRNWGHTLLECALQRHAPAHLLFHLSYGENHASY